ncbi:hypothetical protein HYH02_014666 [Chlamydomonas schloesseri]|uniref:Transmembrane protein 209 n=1 Tax=Chlamydomonas schloesseri TaxID=2026947 RepID=A0A835SUH8_9CHLO|nr:hypothetical protein HYH02_014666 [Chlamydomonas schloesseri]|eukprot:KAG2427020.1 hypothetical protein HYH02_014666 [Chlamydomonas schloesseri]
MARWNTDPSGANTVVAPVVRSPKAARSVGLDALLTVISVAALNSRSTLVSLLPVPWLRLVLQLVLWVLPLVFSGRALDTLVRWRNSQAAVRIQDSVTGNKRKLYGLAPPPAKVEPLRQRRPFSLNPARDGAAAGAAPKQLTPITPPQRYNAATSATGVLSSTPYSAAAGGMGGGGGGGSLLGTPQPLGFDPSRTPLSDPFRRSPAPGFSPGGAVVASPKELNYYFDNLVAGGGGAGGLGGMGAGGAGVAGGAAGMGLSPQQVDMGAGLYGYSTAAGGGAYGGLGGDQDQVPTGTLPVGVPAPMYRMTWMPKKAATVAAADTPTLAPSAPEEVDDFVVSVLRARQDWLELWTERLREWLAGRVLQPLVAAVQGAHEPVNALLQQFNHSHRLPPLPDVLSDSRAGGGTGGGGGAAAAAVDVDGVVRQLVAMLQQHIAQQPAAAATPKVKELLAAVNRYADLLAVVRGKRPADILPPSPPGYVWARLQQLADSSCLKDFTWNGGSAYGGRPWSPDQLPNDSALILYLFAAFLDAPGWTFTAPPNTQHEGCTQPLHLGTLTPGARPNAPASAILTFRPERHGRELDALLGLQLQTPGPLFCYLAAGRLLVLAHYQYVAVFHAILFFLQYHKVRYGGSIGRQHMGDADLGLEGVVQPPPVGAVVALGSRLLGGLGWFA